MGFELLRGEAKLDNNELGPFLDSSSGFGFFTFISNLLTGSLLCLLYLFNAFFRGFCFVVYKSFKVIHLLFTVIETIFSFIEGLLSWNYSLVSRGVELILTLYARIVDCYRLASNEFCELISTVICMIYNLPIALLQLTEKFTKSVLNTTYSGITSFFELSGYLIKGTTHHISQLVTLLTTLSKSTYCIVFNTAKQLYGMLHTILATAASCTIKASKLILVPITALCDIIDVLLHIILEIPRAITWTMASVYSLFGMALDGIYELTCSFVDFIIMPFSLENIKHIFKSIHMLFHAIFSLLMSPIYLLVDICLEITHLVWGGIAEIGNIGVQVVSVLNRIPLWLIVIMLMTLITLHFIAKKNVTLQKLLKLIHNLYSAHNVGRDNHNELEIIREELDLGEDEPEIIREERPRRAVEHEDEATNDNGLPMAKNVMSQDPMTDEPHICIVCQENQRNVLLLPCKHLCLCHICVTRLGGHEIGRSCCPLCRKIITDTMKVYM